MSETEAHKPICEYFQHVTKTKQKGTFFTGLFLLTTF